MAMATPYMPATTPHQIESESDTATVGRTSSNAKFDSNHPLWNDLAPTDSYHDGVYWVSDFAMPHHACSSLWQAGKRVPILLPQFKSTILCCRTCLHRPFGVIY